MAANSDTFKKVIDLLADDEQTSLEVFVALAKKFGWATLVFTRQDFAQLWLEETGQVLTEERWDMVRNTKSWSHLYDVLAEDAWHVLRELVLEQEGAE